MLGAIPNSDTHPNVAEHAFHTCKKYCKISRDLANFKVSFILTIYSHGHSLSYGYLISPMKMRSL